jgi:RNA ligase
MKHEFIKTRDKLVEDKVLRGDNRGDLVIYTYGNNCKTWDVITLNSRGNIYNRETAEIVAQPFPKFFNLNEREETQSNALPWNDGFRIFKKQDGWLGILYRENGQHRIATRGSFKSVGAIWATEFLKRYDLTYLPDEVTLIFELICPATHIVVNYGDREDLVLLAAYNRHTGEEYEWDQIEDWSDQFGFTLTESYDSQQLDHCKQQLKSVSGAELEGFVVRFDNGLRVKMKSEDYFRRSKLLANLTPLTIWSRMHSGMVSEDTWIEVDKEYHDQLNIIVTVLVQRYRKVAEEVRQQFSLIIERDDRRIFAERAQKMFHQPAMFALFDGKHQRVDDYIMKRIKPHGNIFV